MRNLFCCAVLPALGLLAPGIEAQRPVRSAAPTGNFERRLPWRSPLSSQPIGEGSGGFQGDLIPGDFFGADVAGIGDLNGDGTPDLAVRGGELLWLLFMHPTGVVMDQREISIHRGSVDAIGDLDGDGTVELAVGDPSSDPALPGAVTILFLNQDGTVRGQSRIVGAHGASGAGPADFGLRVAGLGDIDGDLVPDIAVGTLSEVWVVRLNPDGTAKARQDFFPGHGGFPVVLDPWGENAWVMFFGMGVDGLGDFDGDGIPDLIVGGFERPDIEAAIGHVWITYLNPDGSVKDTVDINSDDLAIHVDHGSWAGGGAFGTDVACLGDLDDDGVTDIAVGAPDWWVSCDARPAVWILRLRSNGSVREKFRIGDGTGPFDLALQPGDYFGYSLDSAGDIDGDGRQDLVVGAPLSFATQSDECWVEFDGLGLVWLLYGLN